MQGQATHRAAVSPASCSSPPAPAPAPVDATESVGSPTGRSLAATVTAAVVLSTCLVVILLSRSVQHRYRGRNEPLRSQTLDSQAAVCIRGTMRHFRQTHSTLVRNVISHPANEQLGFDTFIYSSAFVDWPRGHALNQAEVRMLYKPKRAIFEAAANSTEHDRRWKRSTASTYVQLRRISRCYQLIVDEEEARGSAYRWVVSVRSDVFFAKPLNLLSLVPASTKCTKCIWGIVEWGCENATYLDRVETKHTPPRGTTGCTNEPSFAAVAAAQVRAHNISTPHKYVRNAYDWLYISDSGGARAMLGMDALYTRHGTSPESVLTTFMAARGVQLREFHQEVVGYPLSLYSRKFTAGAVLHNMSTVINGKYAISHECMRHHVLLAATWSTDITLSMQPLLDNVRNNTPIPYQYVRVRNEQCTATDSFALNEIAEFKGFNWSSATAVVHRGDEDELACRAKCVQLSCSCYDVVASGFKPGSIPRCRVVATGLNSEILLKFGSHYSVAKEYDSRVKGQKGRSAYIDRGGAARDCVADKRSVTVLS